VQVPPMPHLRLPYRPLTIAALIALTGTTGCVSARRPQDAAPNRPFPPILQRPEEAPTPTFTEETSALGFPEISARFTNWLDADNDGRPDLLVDGNRLFLNAGTNPARFTDVTAPSGLSEAGKGSALCVDYDNDGWTDIVTTCGGLWQNQRNGTFEDVAECVGFAPHSKAGVIGAGDINNDGFIDLYIGTKEDWNGGNAAYYPHQLWLSKEGKQFREIGEEAGINEKRYGRGVLFSDVDGDGLQDIFVANYRLQPNLLWRNLGDNRFKNVAVEYGVAGRFNPKQFFDKTAARHYGFHYGHTIGACWLDFDNDGLLDLFTANLVHKYVGPSGVKGMRYDIRGYVCDDSAIYRHMGDSFQDWRSSLQVPLKPIGGRLEFRGDELWSGCIPADANNDGWIDVFVPQIYNLPYAKARLFVNIGGTRFEDRASKASIQRIDTYAGAWADIDGDGWMDLATAGRPQKGAPVRLCVYRNHGTGEGAQGRWLKIRLSPGDEQNTTVGARIIVRRGALRMYREVGAGSSSYGQQNDPALHFGLGQGTGPADIHVAWPNGAASHLTSEPDKRLKLVMPPAPAATK
jgi:enediyne biosynthesis protein E4